MGPENLYITSNLLTLVAHVSTAARSELRKNTELTITQYRILSLLERHGSGAYVGDIASWLRLSVPTVTEASKELVSRGYMVRARDGADRRHVLQELTAEGVRVLRKADMVLARFVRDIWRPLSDEHKSIIIDGAKKIDVNFKGGLSKRNARFIAIYLEVFFITNNVFEQAVSQHGVTAGQFRVLFELANHGKPLTMGNLADRLIIRPNKLTGTVDALVHQGLAIRSESPTDLRSFTVAITTKGLALLEETTPTVERAFSQGTYLTSRSDRDIYRDEADLIVRELRRHY